jgi:hypothetical protein
VLFWLLLRATSVIFFFEKNIRVFPTPHPAFGRQGA